jgi:endonuclease-3 related protein
LNILSVALTFKPQRAVKAKLPPTPAKVFRRAYELMFKSLGHRHWWPSDTDFETCVGAILTQNTNWSNVRHAIDNLKSAQVLESIKLYALPEAQLAQLIQPAGYYNVKARRLRSFLRVLVEEFDGQLERLFDGETPAVRERLLAINGIGPETADSMLLYAGRHLSFVVDAYTKRIFQRHHWAEEKPTYDDLQKLLSQALNHLPPQKQLDYWQDYHAQLVAVGNRFCRTKNPRCDLCPLHPLLNQNPKKV